MSLHIRYVGLEARLIGREGIALSVNPENYLVLLLYPYQFPPELIRVMRAEIEIITPKLRYEYPNDINPNFYLFAQSWNLKEMWSIIRADRPTIPINMNDVDYWHQQYLDGTEEKAVWGEPEIAEDGRTVQRLISGTPLISIDLEWPVDLELPIVMAPIAGPGKGLMILDGWESLHEAYKRRRKLSAYVLTTEEEVYCRGGK